MYTSLECSVKIELIRIGNLLVKGCLDAVGKMPDNNLLATGRHAALAKNEEAFYGEDAEE